ncbi:endonuclease III domain-containing protein [Archaeoglobus veneficus]|uniref:Endonuclease III n=1 Tax=Archaeoglobus veneficus (strain DSM 11195 / SNP6) TaxID=693661 RepID=F2KQ12_ARCVS|nr:endonuclease III [Archaeoglobus veneficus]AEA47615.1 DNA-(apurinic or apyrimidinic site) lyase [Archaeoglobus veneficus SNP6]
MDWQKFISTMESEAKKRSAPVFTLKDFLKTPFQHLVFAVLSSRTRDEQTAKVAKKLFERVKKPEDLATMPVEEIERLIRGVGFYRVKARKLKELAKVLVEMGSVPDTYDELVKLPGVGRKTANVVLASAFGKAAIGVDTHVHRVSNRMGLVRTKKPEETENELKKIIPRELWTRVNRAMVGFGQTVCRPLKPLCDECPFTDWCPKNGVKKG